MSHVVKLALNVMSKGVDFIHGQAFRERNTVCLCFIKGDR